MNAPHWNMDFHSDELWSEEDEASICRRCNLDAHYCPGCGDPIAHGEAVCEACVGALETLKKEETK